MESADALAADLSERQRAALAASLGALLGAVLAAMGRRAARSRR